MPEAPPPITAETPLTVTLPAGVWRLLRAGLDHVPVGRAVTDPVVASVDAALNAALAEMEPPRAPFEPPAPPPAEPAPLRDPPRHQRGARRAAARK